QLLRCDRGTAHLGIPTVEPTGQPAQHLIHHRAKGAQRMIRAHPHLGGQITEHMILLMIFSTHAFSYHGPLWISKYFFRILLRHTVSAPSCLRADSSVSICWKASCLWKGSS